MPAAGAEPEAGRLLTGWSPRIAPGNLELPSTAIDRATVSDMTGLTQPWHIILILLIALMLFGGRRLPEIGRSLGTGMREFKDSITGHTPAEASPQLAPPEATAPAPQPSERETA
jgi:sec-independent protein translocase protein TatA